MTKHTHILDEALRHPLTRRTFLKGTAATAGVAAAGATFFYPRSAEAAVGENTPDALETATGTDVRYSVCLGCHSKCGIAVRVKDGEILKIDGNPWHANNAEADERLRFSAPVEAGLTAHATLCPKGQAGVEVYYNPFRLKKPLKRVGARGAGKWKEVSWDEALTDIAARLKPYYEGYANGQYIHGQPALGTVANQVIFSPGRWQHGQKEFTDRMLKSGFGTVNARLDHTSICETTHHVASKFASDFKKSHFKPDMLNAEYILWFGTNPAEANFPAQTLAKRLAKGRNAGVKHVIIDPRQSRSAAFAHRWLPVRVNGDVALALGIARRLIETGVYDAVSLEAANNQAGLATTNWDGATKDLNYNPTDAGWLVVVGAPTEQQTWLFHREGGSFVVVNPSTGDTEALDRDPDAPAQYQKTLLDGTETNAVDAAAAGLDAAVTGDWVIDLGNGLYGAPAFQLYRQRVFSKSMEEYATISGIDADTITAVADEFGAAGHRAATTTYRGACQRTNGMATMQAILALNSLVGSWDWKGGALGGTGGHLHEAGGKAAGQLSVKKVPNGRSPSGPQITRVKTFFDSELAAALGESLDQPTKRPWFPWALDGNYQEIIPSIEDQYPYPVGVLMTLWNNMPYSTPAAKEAAYRVLTDESLVPFHVCFDIEVSELASLADYIIPDGTYFERWSTPHNAPVILSKMSGFRSPVAGYYADKGYWDAVANGTLQSWNYTIDWSQDEGPFTAEDIFIEIMRRVAGGSLDAFAGLGANAFYASDADMAADGVSPAHRNEVRTAWDWYWNMLVNWAIEAGADPNDTAGIHSLIHDIVRRGGWFQDTTDASGNLINEYDGDFVKNKTKLGSAGKSFHFFFEYAYPSSHPDRPGERYEDPFARRHYDPLPGVHPVIDSSGQPVDDGPDFPFTAVTYHPMWHSQGRTSSLPSLTVLEPENFVEMNSADARRLNLWNGDLVKITSATNSSGVKGRVRVTERIRPGVIAVSHSRGRWEAGSRSYKVGTQKVDGVAIRGAGVTINPVLHTDPVLGNVCLQEPIGGSASFYDTKVKIEKVIA